jgi:AraC-type DNA-binding domain-containing proteins
MANVSNIKTRSYKDTLFFCEVSNDRICENMVPDHMLVYVLSGEMTLQTRERRVLVKNGEAVFIKKDHSSGAIKQPAKDGAPFRGLFIAFRPQFLRQMASNTNLSMPLVPQRGKMLPPYQLVLPQNFFLQGLFHSIEQYFEADEYPSDTLLNTKLCEAVLILLQTKPELAESLFDFAPPYKINLENFMENNFKCELSVEQFAHFTGRSLTSFKKEFYDIFHQTPSRWIVWRRLQEAKNLMEKYHLKAMDVYAEVGFKNLSHFHTAFKKEFGFPPSAILQ